MLVALIEALFEELDLRWKPIGGGRLRLKVIGSAALMLQTEYDRGTKDGDVLETEAITPEVKARLLAFAGKGTELHKRFRMYLDIVIGGLPFLPQRPIFHPVAKLDRLKHLSVEALDVVDVVVSKFKRFSLNDEADVRGMAELGLLDHRALVRRFKSAVDRFQLDARAAELPRIIKNFNKAERDYLGAVPTTIDLPDLPE
ncbi:MAG: DUF6036 family nucleotidyltransferase [Elusimicrobiota bacterium]|jgi:hypothetical protein